MNLLLITGELSGDIYAGELAKQLKKKESITLHGLGGQNLQKQCDHFICDITQHHTIGLFESTKQYLFIKKQLNKLKKHLLSHRIHKAILIDFQHTNFKIAHLLQQYNIAIISFITPNFWIYKDIKQAKKIATYSEYIIPIFEQEYHLYKSLHTQTHYFGHPLSSTIKNIPTPTFKDHRITLLPGSRKQEITYLLPIMLQTIQLLQKESNLFTFSLSISDTRFTPLIMQILKQNPIKNISIKNKKDQNPFLNTDCLICATGTASLEAIYYNLPVIILGALSPISYFIAIHILKYNIPFAGLPNIIAQKQIVPEFIQNKLKPNDIAKKTKDLLEPESRKKLLQNYQDIKNTLTQTQDPLTEISKFILSTL